MVAYAIEHGYASYLRPDRPAIERALKALDEQVRPQWVREEWQAVLSIDKDLSALLETERNPVPEPVTLEELAALLEAEGDEVPEE